MNIKNIKILFCLFIAFFLQITALSYSNEINKATLNNLSINEYDNNNISIKLNSDNPLKEYETKQHNDITTIILALTTVSSNFQIQKCNCNNLVKKVEIQYLPYLNKDTNSYGYTKIRLYTNPDIQVMLEFADYNKPLSNNSTTETIIVKNYVTNLKKSPQKFKSKNIMSIINNVSSENKKTKLIEEDRRNEDDINWDEKKLIEYKNSPIKFPITKEIKFFITNHKYMFSIGFVLILLFVVLGVKKKRLEGKIVRLESNKIDSGKLNNINEDNFLDFLEDIQELNIFDNETIDSKTIENINSLPETTTEAETNIDNDEQFKKFLVEKVMNDITNINFCDLEEDKTEFKNQDYAIYEDVEDNLAMTFNQFIEETLTPKFDIKNDMTQLYDLNNQNEIEDLKKQTTFDTLNADSQIQEIKSEVIETEKKDPNLLSNLNFNTNESLSFVKDENNNYSLLFSNNGEKNIIKTYDNLLSKNMSMRLKEDENGIKTYVLRANSHKYLAKLESNNFEIVYEL